MSDPNFSDVALLLHCNGSDASTTFTDSGPDARTVTAISPAQIDTAQSKFGGASGLFDGLTSALTVADASAFSMGTGAFTVELWFRMDALPDEDNLFRQLVNKYDQSSGVWPWGIYIDGTNANKLTATCYNTSDTAIATIAHGTTPSTGVWYHVALVRDGTTFKLYLDGVAAATAPTSSASLKVSADPVVVGGTRVSGVTLDTWGGWIDEVRITKGVARYTSDFTPPTGEFEEGSTGADAYIAHDPGPLSTDALLLVGQSGAFVSADSPLGAALILASNFHAFLAADSPLGAALVRGFSDFTLGLAPEVMQLQRYFCDLDTPGGVVRVPISSWQSTQQTGAACYAQAVVPGSDLYADDLNDATGFVIWRQARLKDKSTIEIEVVRSTLDTLQFSEGRINRTATMSGYGPALEEDPDPDPAGDRTLVGVRSVSTYPSGARVRCAIDWLVKPAQRAYYADTSMIVSFVNYYVTQSNSSVESYMDVGERLV